MKTPPLFGSMYNLERLYPFATSESIGQAYRLSRRQTFLRVLDSSDISSTIFSPFLRSIISKYPSILSAISGDNYNRFMSALVCSLSGGPLIHPVVSAKTGHLYQKSTILHYIAVHNSCPHTGTPLDAKDLVDLANSNTNVMPSHQSIPQLADKLSGEIDLLIMQAHLLKKQLRERREELATSLYKQDAAIRVIAGLKEQRDQGRGRIAELMEQLRVLENK